MAKDPRVRFAFRITDGPSAGLSCGGWRIWTHAEDTYVTAKQLGDTWKVSLHGDQFWASAVTKENSLKPDTVLPAGMDRAVWRFTPTEFVDGRRNAFAVGVYRSALTPEPVDPKESVIAVEDRRDALTLAVVRMTEPGVEPDPGWALVDESLLLSSGRRVWVTKHFETFDEPEPEFDVITTMITAVSPENDEVNVPGWIVSGMALG